MMLEILVHLGWSSSGLKTILFSFRKLQDSNWSQIGWLTGIEEDDEGCPCIFASTPFNNEWHLNVVWSSQLNAKLKHSILFQQATWDRFVTMIPWKTHLGVPRVLGQQWGGPIFLRGFPILQFGVIRGCTWSVGPTIRWLNLSSSWFLWNVLWRPLWFTHLGYLECWADNELAQWGPTRWFHNTDDREI